MATEDPCDRRIAVTGVAQAGGAYALWGIIFPVYFKALIEVAVMEVIAVRVLTGLPILAAMILHRGSWKECVAAIARPSTRWALLASTLCIATMWVIFLLSVFWNRLTDASFGYYITPLISVFLGLVVLRERLRPLQALAVCMAFASVVLMAVLQGGLPWISLTIAVAFGLYGLLRKQMAIGSAEGLAIEMAAMLPAAIVVECIMVGAGRSAFEFAGPGLLALLMIGGTVTIVPLVLFAAGARKVKLATLGLLQYIAPTGQLIIAVKYYEEPFTLGTAVVFAFVWAAVGLYSVDALRTRRG
jgi:chloramphenicol-sensitive protein RarD